MAHNYPLWGDPQETETARQGLTRLTDLSQLTHSCHVCRRNRGLERRSLALALPSREAWAGASPVRHEPVSGMRRSRADAHDFCP
jgi:hypothetical protein